MSFNPSQKSPWPLWRRMCVRAGISFALPGWGMSVREWFFDPHVVVTFPGEPVAGEYQNVPRDFGPFWADDRRPLKAKFFWFQFALRLVGFDFGIDFWYRQRGAYNS